MILKVGHYYKTTRVRKGHWMKDLFIKVVSLNEHGSEAEYPLQYTLDSFGYHNRPTKGRTWHMSERFCSIYFKEITKEEYDTEWLLVNL